MKQMTFSEALEDMGIIAKARNTDPVLPSFVDVKVKRKARARNTDPVTSHKAAAKVERTGKAGNDRKLAYDLVQKYPGWTAAEYEEHFGKARYSLARRLTELRQAGLIRNGESRRCYVTGNSSLTWKPLK